ncbi:Cellobiose dehydrogenase like protein [Verticillium longisporum]|uniref:Cellobiose dehydrogenase like protein n=1 Tax=Verticillium longisporum TaxID=100787 RepID=A0A8I2Z8M9_VERLO|nr:Cellobiose dehydrogenase like protein [Verticillium longisporum]
MGGISGLFAWVDLFAPLYEQLNKAVRKEDENIASADATLRALETRLQEKLLEHRLFLALGPDFGGDVPGWYLNALKSPEEKQLVFTHPTWLIENGLRAGPVRDYLPLALALPNFSLQTNVKVLRAIREGSAVTGVEVELTPSTRQVINLKTDGAVILAAGALSTPRLLFNSGIGPKAQIETVASGTTNINIPPQNQWIPLPVGENMRDHPIFTVNFNTRTGLTTRPKDAWLTPSQETIDLFAKGSGLLSQSGQRLNFWTGVNNTDGIVRYVQGTVNAPSDNTLTDSAGQHHGRESHSDIPQWPHFVGTAVMGEEDDGSSVVDTDTRVWGTDNLYVVDASIHPEVPTGNTQAPVMVVAEHAVSKILGVEPIKCKTKRSRMFRDRREVLGRSYLRRKASLQQ